MQNSETFLPQYFVFRFIVFIKSVSSINRKPSYTNACRDSHHESQISMSLQVISPYKVTAKQQKGYNNLATKHSVLLYIQGEQLKYCRPNKSLLLSFVRLAPVKKICRYRLLFGDLQKRFLYILLMKCSQISRISIVC